MTRIGQGRLAGKAMAIVLAAVYLAAIGGASLHAATEAHSFCVAHGELVHVGHDADPGAGTADRRDAGPNGAVREGSDAPEHEHCSLASHRAGAAVSTDRDPGLVVRAPAIPAGFFPAGEDVPPGRDVTDVAPKQSPPAA